MAKLAMPRSVKEPKMFLCKWPEQNVAFHVSQQGRGVLLSKAVTRDSFITVLDISLLMIFRVGGIRKKSKDSL